MMNFEPEYVQARKTLLDGLEALSEHLGSLILVGAQAVYLWTEGEELNVAKMTRDADIAIDRLSLASEPLLHELMEKAAFKLQLDGDPGQWIAPNGVEVDLMVSAHQAGRGRRSADLSPHAHKTARRSRGLAPVLVDYESKEIAALTDNDSRKFQIRVAGPAALIIAKLTKIMERSNNGTDQKSRRIKHKDALDIYRLLRALEADELAKRFALHASQQDAKRESDTALEFLKHHSRKEEDFLPRLVAQAIPSADSSEEARTFVYLVEDLASELGL